MSNIAIYSRKSKFTGKGESIENQIIKCKQFISFKFNEDPENVEIFIDEGFSGKNENRPEYQRMFKKVNDGEINKIVIYQLNRLGRNARDIHNTMYNCDNLGVVIYSATEGFDSSTSFGKAVIGILASLAQLEREQLAERVKDNMYTLAKMGRWLGGQSPLGFNGLREYYIDESGKQRSITELKPNKEELKIVKALYNKYLEEKSLSQVGKWSLTNNFKGKNGGNIDKSAINIILQNPVYVKSTPEVLNYLEAEGYEVCGPANGNGILKYGKKEEKIAAVAKHKGVIDADIWLEVQHILKSNLDKAPRLGKTNTALLTGILKCSCGSGMRVAYGQKRKDGTKPFYYTCSMKNNSGGTRCNSKNINGEKFETALIKFLKGYNKETLLVELKSIIKKSESTDLEENSISIDKLINSKNKALKRLFDRLKLVDDDDVAKLILEEIKSEKNAIKELQNKKNDLLNKESELAIDQNQILKVIDEFDNFSTVFDDLNLEDKRNMLHKIIESIQFNENGEFVVNFRVKKN